MRHKELVSELGGSAILILASGLWAYFALRGIKEPLILHFSSYTGINQIGTLGNLLGVSVTGLVLIIINTLIVREVEVRDKALARIIGLSTLFFSVLIFIGFAAIISVNS